MGIKVAEEFEVLKVVCQRLEKGRIPYMITGSIASNFYAVPRMTRDIDIVVEIKKEDGTRLQNIFQDDFYIDSETVTEAIEKRGMFNAIHNEYVFKVDFIVRKDDPYRALEFQRRQQVEIEGVLMWVVTPEDLILSKLWWAKDSLSELQLGDVRNLLRTLKDIDKGYLEKWVHSLHLEEVYAKVKSNE